MTSIGTGYDLSSSTFSPDGRIFQIEYAGKAVGQSGTAIGLRVKDGVVFAVENLVESKLMVPGSSRRIFAVDEHIGLAASGLKADAKHIVSRAQDEADNYRETYHQRISTKYLAGRIANYCQVYTLYSSVRPFGLSSIIGGLDGGKPALFVVEHSGVHHGYRGCAVGKGAQLAKTEIEKLDLESLTCREAVVHAARIIYAAHDESKDKEFELEISWVSTTDSEGRFAPVPRELVEEAENKAKEDLDADMED